MFARRTDWALAPNRLAAALEQHRAGRRAAIDLTVSNPTHVGLTYDAEPVLDALSNPLAMQYQPDPRGLLVARQAVVEYYKSCGHALDPDQLLLTASTSEAYAWVFRLLCDPDDEVLIPAPSYPLFEFLADIQDVRLRPYELFYDHGWHVDIHSLRTNLGAKTRAVIAVHPNNPTGSYLKPSEVREINDVCRSNDLALIVDEVFLDFAINAEQGFSFVENTSALTFTLSGISKICGLPQMKLAWLAVSGPESLRQSAVSRLDVIADTYLTMNAPIQLAAPAFFAQRAAFQAQLLRRIQANLSFMDHVTRGSGSCVRLEMEAGWYAVLRVPVTRSDEDLAVELLHTKGVIVHPGHFYDFPSEGYLVVSLIAREDEFREGVQRLVAFLAA